MEEIEQSAPYRRLDGNEDEWATTGGMGPCTGIFVYEARSKVAYGVHLPSPHLHEVESLAATLVAASNEFAGASGSVDVFVSGCCDDGQAEDDHAPGIIRPFVENEVQRIFPKAKHHFNWPPFGQSTARMDLNLETGEIFMTDF